jgi:polysaccharide export outer membrane protein
MIKNISLISIFLVLLASCGTKKNMVYFQGEDRITDSPSTYTPTFKPDDYISVIVTADNPEAAAPFNFPKDLDGGSPPMRMGGNMMLGMPITNGYLVDEEGFVELPILGRIKVGGLTRVELIEQLKSKYQTYLDNPIVNVKIQNFKISILGDVSSPGIYIIPNERITLVEAIAVAGDLKITGKRNNILVVREQEGERLEYRVDVTGKDFFKSPVYYLQQNDVVYVEPNAGARIKGSFWATTAPVFFSVTSFAITIILLLSN